MMLFYELKIEINISKFCERADLVEVSTALRQSD
jgi:hypothetical protein